MSLTDLLSSLCSPALYTSWDARTNQPLFLRISIQRQLKSSSPRDGLTHDASLSVTFLGIPHRIIRARALRLSLIVDFVGLLFLLVVFININFIWANYHFTQISDEQIAALQQDVVVDFFPFWSECFELGKCSTIPKAWSRMYTFTPSFLLLFFKHLRVF